MKEITRIHIAKTAYDVELAAKKELEAYLKTLESYSNDTDIINDIEIRITEILAERGIKKDGVITEADIKALKHQLGEPREFMTDGDIVIGPDDEAKMTADTVRKLYRDTDNAVLGGVLSGMASFFKIDTVWTRLAFIVLLFASFGTALLVYIVLWIAVPPARTAADKLQMAGRAVTVGSIRELNENEASKPLRGNSNARRALTIIAGIVCIIGATGAAMATAAIVIAVVFGGQHYVLTGSQDSRFMIAAVVFAAVSGLLLTVLFILCAYAAFAQKMTRRVLISICTVIVLGFVSFGAAVGLGQYGSYQYNQSVQANTRDTVMSLPTGVEAATALTVNDARNLDVTYVVTNEKPSAVFKTVVRDGVSIPQPMLTLESGVLQIRASKAVDKDCESMWWCQRPQQAMVIYGPALKQITSGQMTTVNYAPAEQDVLTIIGERESTVIVSSGMVKTLKVTAREDANVTAAVATVQNLEVDVRMSAQVEVGTIQGLVVTDLSSCPLRVREAQVSAADVSSGLMTLNGTSQPAKSVDSGCTEIVIEREDYKE